MVDGLHGPARGQTESAQLVVDVRLLGISGQLPVEQFLGLAQSPDFPQGLGYSQPTRT